MNNYYNCIYMYINKVNGKRYVGQAKDFIQRHKEHIRKHDQVIDKAIDKYGIDNFEIKILAHNIPTQEKLNDYEKFFIKRYNSSIKNGEGYNVAEGGHNGNTMEGKTDEEIEEWKRKIGEGNKGKKGLVGEENPMYNKKGELHPSYGKTRTKESKQKMSISHKGTKATEETRQKMSEAHKGDKNVFYGKKHSDASKQKMSEAKKGMYDGAKNPNASKVLQYTTDGILLNEWETIKEASEQTKTNKTSISMCCSGKRKTAGGFVWKYKKGE